jgi:hypothetical protein
MNKSRRVDVLPNTAIPQDENNFLQKEITYSGLLNSSYNNMLPIWSRPERIVSNLNDKHLFILCKGIFHFGKAKVVTFQ